VYNLHATLTSMVGAEECHLTNYNSFNNEEGHITHFSASENSNTEHKTQVIETTTLFDIFIYL